MTGAERNRVRFSQVVANVEPRETTNVDRRDRPLVYYVTSPAHNPADVDMPAFIADLTEQGIDVAVVDFDDPSVDWTEPDLVHWGSAWKYWIGDNMDKFLALVDRVEASGIKQINPAKVMHAGSDKNYLLDLEAAGGEIIPMKVLRARPDAEIEAYNTDRKGALSPAARLLAENELERAGVPRSLHDRVIDLFTFDGTITPKLVVRPTRSGGAGDGAAYQWPDGAADALQHVIDIQERGSYSHVNDALVSPYLQSIDTEGELSLYVVNGVITHATRKDPILHVGDTRDTKRESHPNRRAYTPTNEELAFGYRTMHALMRALDIKAGTDFRWRQDSIKGATGHLVLEDELMCPVWASDVAPESARRSFTDLLATRAKEEFLNPDMRIGRAAESRDLGMSGARVLTGMDGLAS
jgi:hypothetical protein